MPNALTGYYNVGQNALATAGRQLDPMTGFYFDPTDPSGALYDSSGKQVWDTSAYGPDLSGPWGHPQLNPATQGTGQYGNTQNPYLPNTVNIGGDPVVSGDYSQAEGVASYNRNQQNRTENPLALGNPASVALVSMGGAALGGGLGSGVSGGATGHGLASSSYANAGEIASGAGGAGGGSGGGLASVLGSGSAATPTVAGSLAGVAGTGGAATMLPGWANLAVSAFQGILGSRAADRATNASTAADERGIAEIGRQYDQSRTDQMPWLTAGTNALGKLQDPNAFQASPDYAFRRSEGQRDIGNSFAARGGAASGNALRALTEFNQNLAGSEFGNWWNRQAGLAGVGQTAANSLGAYGANAANNTASLTSNQGATRASGILGGAAAVGNAVNDGYSNYLYQNGGGYLPRSRYGR